MRRLRLLFVGYVTLILFTSSACSPMRFSQYSGPNRRSPVSQEAMAETSFALPVFRSWPNRPYDIIGSVRFENPRQYWDDGVISAAVSEAKHRGGDAIVIREGTEFGVSGNVGSREDRMVLSQGQTSALVIKWKSAQALATEQATLDRFKARFRSAHAALCENPARFEAASDYLRQSGVDLDSPRSSEQLERLLSEIQSSRNGELTGKWLYRCALKRSHLTTSESDLLFGVASVNLKGDVVTVVSTEGDAEINLSGTYDKGRVTGTMGIATISLTCDGVAAPEKISLSGQGHTADGVCQASLILQR